jgi:hypothetical protein
MNPVELSPKSAQPLASTTLSLSNLKITLKANCLLTRRPLCFLTPPRSLFFYQNPWLWITSVLFEHGYKTEIFQLPFQNLEMKKAVLVKNNEQLEKKHLIVDHVTYQNLKKELNNIKDCTITIISSKKIQSPSSFVFQPEMASPIPLSYHLHQLWCQFLGLQTPDYSEALNECPEITWHTFLDHCVHLAEIDFESE